MTNVADDLIAGKAVQHAFLGIRYGNADARDRPAVQHRLRHGLVVLEVQSGTPAAQAGIKPGDLIISVDGQTMNQVEDLIAVLHQHAPGDTVPIVDRARQPAADHPGHARQPVATKPFPCRQRRGHGAAAFLISGPDARRAAPTEPTSKR